MQTPNPYKNGFLRMKRWIKEDISELKTKIKENSFLKKIKKSIIDIILVIIIIIVATVCFSTILKTFDENNQYNKAIIGPKTEEIYLSKADNYIVTYKGDIQNGLIEGQGKLTVTTDSYKMILEGVFNKVESPKENTLQIGTFSNGYITITDIMNNITYNWNGTFDNYKFKTGDFKISKENETIIYSGTFISNKLNGIGSIKLYKSGKSIEINGWFENGELVEKNKKS